MSSLNLISGKKGDEVKIDDKVIIIKNNYTLITSIDGKKYYEMLTNDEKPIFVIEKIDGKFGLKQNSSKEKVQYYREHYWKLENLDKPLKAVSSYKSDELKDICKRLHIDCHDMTKPQMYEKILSKL